MGGKLLDNNKSPSRKGKQIDNRGSSFYIALYWAQSMAQHDESFVELAQNLTDNEQTILQELIDCQGPKMDVGGYWKPDHALASRPCARARRSTPFSTTWRLR